MADYSAKIRLELENEGVLKRLQSRLDEINETIEAIQKLNLKRVLPPQGGKFQKNPNKQALADAEELAKQLKQGIAISKEYAEADKRRYAEGLTGQLKLNNAVELYERRLKNLQRAGAFDVKQRAKNIQAIQEQYEFGLEQKDLKLIQQAAVGLGRLLETQRELNRTAKGSAALKRNVADYNKQIEQLRLLGVTEGKLKTALEARDELNARISRNEIDRARIIEDKLKRQIQLLEQQTKLVKGVGATSPISGLTRAGTVIPGSPAAARVAAETTRQTKALEESESQAARTRLAQAAKEKAASLREQAEATAIAAKATAEATSRVKALEESESQAARTRLAQAARDKAEATAIAAKAAAEATSRVKALEQSESEAARTRLAQAAREKANSLKAQAEAAEAAFTAIRKLEAERSFAARGFRDPAPFDTGGVVRRTIATTSGAFFGPGGAPPTARGAAVEAEAAVRRQVEREFELRQEYEKRLAFIEEDFDKKANFRELNFIQKELEAEIDKIEAITAAQKKADDAALNDFDKRLKARTDAQTETARGRKQRNERLANVTLGAGFPLLFGGGPGAVIGGGLGGLLGAGPQALAAQIGLSALGQVLDQFGASAVELSAALNPLTLDVEKLIPALGATNTETAEYLRKLVDLERQDEALAVATEELAKIVGFEGVRALRDYGDAVVSLNNEWSKLITQLQAGLASLLAGPTQRLAQGAEQARLFRQAQQSTDPRIQELLALRSRPGILGGSGQRSIDSITEEIIGLQRQANQEAQKRAQLEQQKSGSFNQQLRLLTAQTELAALGNDLTKQAVFDQQKFIIQKQKELEIQEAQGDAEKIAIADARARFSLQQLNSDRLEAQLAAEKRLTAEYERQRKELEKFEKQRREQLGKAQTAFVLSGLELQVEGTGTDEKAKRIAEFDLERAKRIAAYTEKIKEALSEEQQRFILEDQLNEINAATIRLQEDLFQIDLKRSELLNKQDPLSRANEEIALLQAKINGTEKEYLLQKQIADLIGQGVALDTAQATVLTIRDLERQNAIIQLQKQLWKDIYSTLTGEIANGIAGLIDGTEEWASVLSNVLNSIGRLLLNTGLNILGSQIFSGGTTTSADFALFADGGYVTKPTNAIIGEGGEPEYVIPFSKMESATENFAAGARGEDVFGPLRSTSIPFSKTTERLMSERSERETVAALNNPDPLDVRFNSQVINNVEYVTAEEYRKGMTQAAERGRTLTLAALQNSVKTRKRVGIG